MPTPSIQTLVTDAQQILNLDSISAIRSVVAVALANANTGTPLNPNLTTQQLWNEFYQVVTKPKSDIESIIANQLMKLLYAPPAPGGAGADQQVIFNDGGVLAGDPQFLWNKTTNLLTVTGSATITGDLTVDTSTLKVDSANNRVGIGTATPNRNAVIYAASSPVLQICDSTTGTTANDGLLITQAGVDTFIENAEIGAMNFRTSAVTRYQIDSTGISTWSVGGSTAMTLNSTVLGVGVTPSVWTVGFKVFQLGAGSALWTNNAITRTSLSANYYYSGGDLFLGNGYAHAYWQDGANGHRWFTSNASNASGAGAAATMSELMRLDASGNLLVGTTSAAGNDGGLKLSNVAGNLGQITFSNNSGSADYVARFNWGSTPTLVGNITVSSGGTAFNTTSDYRLKESVQPLLGGLARVNALKPSVYKWKTDGSNGEGFLAHELAEVVPAAVTGDKDAVNEDGSIKPQGVDLSKVVPILVAAIKELTARVEALEA